MTRLIVAFVAGVAVVFLVECGVMLHWFHPWTTLPAGLAAVILSYAILGKVTA